MKIESEKEEIVAMIGRHFPQTGRKRTKEKTDSTEASEKASTSQLEITTPTTPETEETKRDTPILVSFTIKKCSVAQLLIHVNSCILKVKVGYPSEEKTIDVSSPWGRKNVKRFVCKNYASLLTR